MHIECVIGCAHRGPWALDEEQDMLFESGGLSSKILTFYLGPCPLGWKDRTGSTVLSESFDL